ncbi:MAG: Rpn family recombination-promoting nuclease/putative transposase [Prevotella sp.]|nr:Rpn family recombination-promoting nuclease/putative transposase [Prevotella sp.]MBR0263430.1 Rpn family recombination-promoting nuclease/putative transposase [Prevotella sp.]
MSGKYLDPKADLTFKLVFGEHPDLVMSLLNALLPLDEDGQITSVEYMTPEMVPENPGKKDSVVDVRCIDEKGRQFIVEMQLYWNEFFQQRVLLNASKAVVRQLKKGEDYNLIQPVYCLNLVNDVGFESGPDEFYHDYAIVNVEHSDRIIEGLRFVFVELPKFKPKTIAERKMAVLWLRFLTEISGNTEDAPAELLENELTSKALSIVEKSAMSEAQLYAYEKFWMGITDEKGFLEARYNKGRAEGRAEGKKEANRENARKMKKLGMTADVISQVTGLPKEEIKDL